MKKVFLFGAMVCVLGMSSCTKPKDECTLTGFYRTKWGWHDASITINFSHGMVATLHPPLMYVYEGLLDFITDNELEGLIMGSRPGDVDPGTIEFVIKKEITENGKSWKDVSTMLNKQCGLVGISGGKQDMRDIRAGRDEGDVRCTYAFDMFAHRVKKYIGAFMAVMNGCDILLFTGGIGENAWFMRHPILENMEFLGVKVDMSLNDGMMGEDKIISTPDSRVTTMVVTTDEEFVIASDTYRIVTGK